MTKRQLQKKYHQAIERMRNAAMQVDAARHRQVYWRNQSKEIGERLKLAIDGQLEMKFDK